MKKDKCRPPSDPLLAELLLAQIRTRAGRRVRNVEIGRAQDGVAVRGQADSYYAWQLAIAACQQVLAGRSDLRLDCMLDVDSQI